MNHSLQDLGGGQWIYGPYLIIDNECPYSGYRYQLTYKAISLTWLESLEEAVTCAQQEIENPSLTREPTWPKRKEVKPDKRLWGPLPDDLLEWMGETRPQDLVFEEDPTPEQFEAMLLRHPGFVEEDKILQASEGEWIAWDGRLVKEVAGRDVHHRSRWLRALLTEMGVLATPHPEVA